MIRMTKAKGMVEGMAETKLAEITDKAIAVAMAEEIVTCKAKLDRQDKGVYFDQEDDQEEECEAEESGETGYCIQGEETAY